jgi:hypothetical protein
MKAGLLVTIASHMPARAVGCFRATGFQGAAVSDSVRLTAFIRPLRRSVDFGRERRRLRIGRALGHAVENEMAHLPHLVS